MDGGGDWLLVHRRSGEVLAEAIPHRGQRVKTPKWVRFFCDMLVTVSLDKDLHEIDLRVLFYLVGRTRKGRQVWCYARDIARDTGRNEKTIYRSLRTLERKGYIKRLPHGVIHIDLHLSFRGSSLEWAREVEYERRQA